MSRSYHVTEKRARDAYNQGDIEPTYQASEKSWVKRRQREIRQQKELITNRSIVSVEAARTKLIRRQGIRDLQVRERIGPEASSIAAASRILRGG